VDAAAGPKTKDQKRAEAEARNRAYRATRDGKRRLEKVDAELASAQSRHDALVALMAEPEFYTDRAAFDSALVEYTDLKRRIPLLENEWIALSEEIERLSISE
jgi:ATP-binding cassette subfamily F protein 3